MRHSDFDAYKRDISGRAEATQSKIRLTQILAKQVSALLTNEQGRRIGVRAQVILEGRTNYVRGRTLT